MMSVKKLLIAIVILCSVSILNAQPSLYYCYCQGEWGNTGLQEEFVSDISGLGCTVSQGHEKGQWKCVEETTFWIQIAIGIALNER